MTQKEEYEQAPVNDIEAAEREAQDDDTQTKPEPMEMEAPARLRKKTQHTKAILIASSVATIFAFVIGVAVIYYHGAAYKHQVVTDDVDINTLEIQWSNALVNHWDIMDQQHKALVDKIGSTLKVFREATSKHQALPIEALQMVIGEIAADVVFHFNTEEQAMDETKYLGYAEHKNSHRIFVGKVAEVHERLLAGDASVVTPKLFSFIISWLAGHITKADAPLAQWVIAHQQHPSIVWSNALVNHWDIMDQQHKALVDKIGLVLKAYNDATERQTPLPVEVLRTVIADVAADVIFHFNTEEQAMDETKYPDSAQHKDEHRVFVGKVAEVHKRLLAGDTSVVTPKLFSFIIDWLGDHIQYSDALLARWVNEHQHLNLTIEWCDALVNHWDIMDQQHKALVEKLGAVLKAYRDATAKQMALPVEVLRNAIADIAADVIFHFNTEEQEMDKTKYPDAAQHKDAHRIFVGKVAEVHERLLAGDATVVTPQLLSFIVNWLANHIRGNDAALASWIKYGSRGIQPPAQNVLF